MSEITFDKYAVKGAYHWQELHGPVHRLNAYTQGRYAQVLRALDGLDKGARVLDVGCGDGALTGLIARQLGAVVDGVDTTPLSLDLARQEFVRAGLSGEFQRIDGYDYPYGDGMFAAVVCSDVIEHVREPEQMLKEMWRVLAPHGTLVVTTPVRYTEAPLDVMHVQEWFPSSFKALCEETLGVRVIQWLSHPVALAELYAAPTQLGRIMRLGINLMARTGRNPFLASRSFRAFSTQTIVARKS